MKCSFHIDGPTEADAMQCKMIRSISELFPVYNLLSLTPIETLGVTEGPEGKLGWCTHEILTAVRGLGSARCVQVFST